MTELGDRIRSAREAKRLTLRQLEALVGVSNAALSQIEHGAIARPRMGTLHMLAEHLDIPYAELLRLAGWSDTVDADRESQTVAGAAFLGANDLTKEEADEVKHFIERLRRRRRTHMEDPG